jgi:hypothetical protein
LVIQKEHFYGNSYFQDKSHPADHQSHKCEASAGGETLLYTMDMLQWSQTL